MVVADLQRELDGYVGMRAGARLMREQGAPFTEESLRLYADKGRIRSIRVQGHRFVLREDVVRLAEERKRAIESKR